LLQQQRRVRRHVAGLESAPAQHPVHLARGYGVAPRSEVCNKHRVDFAELHSADGGTRCGALQLHFRYECPRFGISFVSKEP
jgi:hypothetical protein